RGTGSLWAEAGGLLDHTRGWWRGIDRRARQNPGGLFWKRKQGVCQGVPQGPVSRNREMDPVTSSQRRALLRPADEAPLPTHQLLGAGKSTAKVLRGQLFLSRHETNSVPGCLRLPACIRRAHHPAANVRTGLSYQANELAHVLAVFRDPRVVEGLVRTEGDDEEVGRAGSHLTHELRRFPGKRRSQPRAVDANGVQNRSGLRSLHEDPEDLRLASGVGHPK